MFMYNGYSHMDIFTLETLCVSITQLLLAASYTCVLVKIHMCKFYIDVQVRMYILYTVTRSRLTSHHARLQYSRLRYYYL